MTDTTPAAQPDGRARRWATRIIGIVAFALCLGWASGAAMRADARLTTPPGFSRGLLHGALMPLAWPSLLTGHDQEIYAGRNRGRPYKTGYSLGVNISGALFFGWAFVRLHRWRSAKEAR